MNDHTKPSNPVQKRDQAVIIESNRTSNAVDELRQRMPEVTNTRPAPPNPNGGESKQEKP